MKISELKAYINDPKHSIVDVMSLRLFFLDNQTNRNRRRLERTTAKAARIEKIGEKRFGVGWWK